MRSQFIAAVVASVTFALRAAIDDAGLQPDGGKHGNWRHLAAVAAAGPRVECHWDAKRRQNRCGAFGGGDALPASLGPSGHAVHGARGGGGGGGGASGDRFGTARVESWRPTPPTAVQPAAPRAAPRCPEPPGAPGPAFDDRPFFLRYS